MCTSFVIFGEETYIGMNFDILDCEGFKVVQRAEDQLVVMIKRNDNWYDTFGFNENGNFCNMLMVTSNGKGLYKRGKNVIHMTKFLEQVLGNRIAESNFSDYLETNEIVNVPQNSVHSMVVIGGKGFIVEPGRRNIEIKKYGVLTNFSISDDEKNKVGIERYNVAMETIAKSKKYNVDVAYEILKKTQQISGDYKTKLSMIFIPTNGVICLYVNGNDKALLEYEFKHKYVTAINTGKRIKLTKSGIIDKDLLEICV